MVSPQDERLTFWRKKIHAHLVNLLGPNSEKFIGDMGASAHQQAEFLVQNLLDQYDKDIPQKICRKHLSKIILDYTLGFGLIDDLVHDDDITEIMVNGTRDIFIEKSGKLNKHATRFDDPKEVLRLIERIVTPLGRRIDEGCPLVDARLPDGSRVNAIIPPISLTGPCLTIRKFKKTPFTLTELIKMGTLTEQLTAFLKICVQSKINILVSGGTGSGKTTLLNTLAGFIPNNERVITIEDAAELQLPQEHIISLECRHANIEGSGAITIRNLVKNALRMRPDRIVVGECRGGEALDMLQAMNTGHDGSMTTGHANNTREMLLRLETMVLMSGIDLPLRAIREQISSALDLIIQLDRFPDGSRRLTRVSEVCGIEGESITMQDIFLYDHHKQKILSTGLRPNFNYKLERSGLSFEPDFFIKGMKV